MAKQFDKLSSALTDFIHQQKMFFVGTAASTGRVNVSPKGMDTFHVMDAHRVLWLNLTGSGNETAAHLLQNNRMTIMFCAFEGNPLILRLYGKVNMIHDSDPEWPELIKNFGQVAGARQIMDLQIEMVQTSCGFGVPLMAFKEERSRLVTWATEKGEDGLKAYQKEKNTVSIDGFSTDIEV